MSDKYYWDASSVLVDSNDTKRVLVSSAYLPSAPQFNNTAKIATQAIHHCSFVSYGIPYPYNKLTVFNGKSSAASLPMLHGIR